MIDELFVEIKIEQHKDEKYNSLEEAIQKIRNQFSIFTVGEINEKRLAAAIKNAEDSWNESHREKLKIEKVKEVIDLGL
jgi:hypothetical protein